MPTPITESSEGGQHVEWSETFHAFLFRARIYLKRFWWIIILTVATGTLIEVWKNHDVPPVYQSTAEMSVDMVVNVPGATSVIESTLNYFATQVHLLQDPSLQAEAYDDAKKLSPAGGPTPTVSKPIINFLQGTLILQLEASGSDPKFTQDFLQKLMEDFLDKNKRHRETKLSDTGIELTKTAQKYQDDLDNLRKQRSEMVSQKNLADLPKELAAAGDQDFELKNHAADLWRKLNFLRTPKAHPDSTPQAGVTPAVETPTASAGTPPTDASTAAKETALAPAPEIPQPGEEVPLLVVKKFANYAQKDADDSNVEAIDQEIARVNLLPPDPDYEQLKDRRAQLDTLTQELTTGGMGEKHPKLLDLEAKIDSLKNDLWVLRGKRVTKLEQAKASIESELVNASEQEKALESQIVEFQINKNDLDDLDKRISDVQGIYNSLAATFTTLPETENLGQEMLSISTPATNAGVVSQNVARKIGEGGFVGLVAGVAIIFLLGGLDGRVMSVEDLTQRFEEPMLGVIPMQKRVNGQVELLKNNDQRQMFAESCRNIRSSLLYMDRQGQRPRVIMLTSSMPSEGKSTLSANLAITLGFATSRTLLVDADMRRGQLHKRFGLKNDLGLAEHIKDGLPLDKVIQHTSSENLDFIPCGHYPTQPGELLMSDRFRESIQTMRQQYDFVIFDSPPILLTDDAASFATRADAVLFVVRAGFTRLRQVRTSMESLNRRGVNVYGMVVNFIDHREPGYYSYRYYDYYSYRPNRPAS